MAITSNSYTGNGSTTLYSFTFPYLDTADVKVSLNGTVTTAYTFANATTIQFTTAPGAGVAIRIYRETDDTALEAVFSPGSSIRASDLNSDFDQLLYLGQESNNIAEDATTTANTALTTANTAISTANAATSTANTALSNSATAVSTANTASTNASNAVTTANTASSNASAAVTTANAATVTANSAASTAATALSTANTASSNASAAVSTANTASTNASNAVTTANTALSTANTASSNASTAVTTANNAVSTANGAASTASTALTTANAAISAVASAVIYTPVANLTALAALTPSNGDYFELTDSTGAEGSALITGVTVGLVGAPGLTFRLRYDAPPGIFTFLGYFANDSETRYLKFSGGTLTGQLRGDDSTSASTPGFAFDGDPNTGIGRPGADELALITGGTARLTIDPAGAVAVAGSLSQGGNAVVVTTDSRLSDTRVPTDGSVTNTKVAAAAAIDGTKISPNFGSQNVVTTGTVSGASLIPTSSSVPTNGVYLPSANNVAISTNGSGRLFVSSTGQIGIGGTPGAPLHVKPGSGDSYINVTSVTSSASVIFNDSGTGGNYPKVGSEGNSLVLRGGSLNNAVTIDSSQRVGIGTSSPTGLLTVAATSPVIDWTNSLNTAFKHSIESTGYSGSAAGNTLAFKVASGSGTQATVMTLDGSGRVGIGTSAPVYLLDVQTTSGNGIRYKSTSTGYGLYIGDNAGTPFVSTDSASPLTFGQNNTERARIDTSGRLLVGTSTSDGTLLSSLQVVGSSWASTQLLYRYDANAFGPSLYLGKSRSATIGTKSLVSSGDELGSIVFYGADGSADRSAAAVQAYVDGTPGANDMPGRLVFSTTADGASSPTERMRITQAGHVGIGVTPTYRFDVAASAGNSYIGFHENTANTADDNLYLWRMGANATSASAHFLYCQTSTTQRFGLRGNGGLANFQANNVNLSDRNTKKDISPAADTWECIKEWEIVNYRYKDQPDDADLNLGVIAQQVAESCPEVITVFQEATEDEPEKLGVKEQQMYWMAIKALQEAQVRIEALEAEVAALKAA